MREYETKGGNSEWEVEKGEKKRPSINCIRGHDIANGDGDDGGGGVVDQLKLVLIQLDVSAHSTCCLRRRMSLPVDFFGTWQTSSWHQSIKINISLYNTRTPANHLLSRQLLGACVPLQDPFYDFIQPFHYFQYLSLTHGNVHSWARPALFFKPQVVFEGSSLLFE